MHMVSLSALYSKGELSYNFLHHQYPGIPLLLSLITV
jgi:hypothetical protein